MRLYVYLLALMMGMSTWATEKVMSTETTTPTKHSIVTHQGENEQEGFTDEELQELFAKSKQHAEQGDAEAQYNLALMYAKGRGVIKDAVITHMWFNIAVSNGYEDAKTNRDVAKSSRTW